MRRRCWCTAARGWGAPARSSSSTTSSPPSPTRTASTSSTSLRNVRVLRLTSAHSPVGPLPRRCTWCPCPCDARGTGAHTGREDRMAIVQHTVQYKFAYQACINYAEIVMAASDGDIFAMESPSRKSLSKIDADPIYEATTDTDGTSLFRLRRGATSMKKTKEDKAVFEETPAAEEDVPAHESSSTNVLEDEPWYFGALSRDAMSAILKDSPVGSFGVRVSSQPGCFVLTFQQEDKQGHTKRLQSILIQPCTKPTGGSAFKLDQCSDRLFSSIVELVNYFITNAVSYIDDRTGVTHRLFLDNTLED
eukprot:m.290837 g.290837  ORF g.290837 m.290837 type:complete len:306 (+) comp19976_c0_seq26:2729-3646(+)